MTAGESIDKILEYDLTQEKKASLDKVPGSPLIASNSIDGCETSMGESKEVDCAVVKDKGGGGLQESEESERAIQVPPIKLKLEKQVRQ